MPVAYEIGSGSHAIGYIARVGDHLFQSPLSYYTLRRIWDVAPGYEATKMPGFTRPVTAECLFCHADKPLPVPNTMNQYQVPPFEGTAIQCGRCHGPAEAHLAKPVPGSILNPAKLPRRQRDSVCEQCHLTGEVRIPNPGKALTDFRPGEALEDVFTVYVAGGDSDKTIKVVSHVEQLARSACARLSGGRLWCGTCHNPHQSPAHPADYFRQQCLGCHGATLEQAHASPGRDCVGCHMPRLPAKDGGHTAFTDHRIRRTPDDGGGSGSSGELVAWHEPPAPLRARNLALALVTVGAQERRPQAVIRGFQMLAEMKASSIVDDDAALAALGSVLLTAKQPVEAAKEFARALELRAGYAPYETGLAEALLDKGDREAAMRHLEHAVERDPLLGEAVRLLSQEYAAHGDPQRAAELRNRYRAAIGFVPAGGK